jgi:hypothetical protein
MYTTRRVKAELERKLSGILLLTGQRASAASHNVESKLDAFGEQRSASLIPQFLGQLNDLQKHALESATEALLEFAGRADMPSPEIVSIARPYLDNLHSLLLATLPSAGGSPEEQQQRFVQYGAVFEQRLQDMLRDFEIDCAEIRKQLMPNSPSSAKVTQPMRILFLAANPTTTSPLDIEEELRSLESALRSVKYRDQVILTAGHAVRPDDLVRYVRSERPTVVHFSGHGSEHGIVLRNDEGGHTAVTGASLQRFFLDRGVRLVVLNACYTQEQAQLLPDSVSAVVGTTDAVGDHAARLFTVAFYRTLGDGHSIREAFRDGSDAVDLNSRKDVFWANGELDQALVTSSEPIKDRLRLS